MPLPDASKKSPRVYTLLQNTDLDNVTFDSIQAVGNPIAIEEANEDEMRRLVLVNLCRLVTSGEWTGLLEAGGGDQKGTPFGANPTDALVPAAPNIAQRTLGFHDASGSAIYTGWVVDNTEASYFPFWSGPGGTLDSFTLLLETSGSDDVGFAFYSSTNDLPATRLAAQTDIDCTSAALITTDISGLSLTLEANTIYFLGMTSLGTGSNSALNCVGYNNHRYASTWPLTNTATDTHQVNVERCAETSITGGTLPSSATVLRLYTAQASAAFATVKCTFTYDET